jgi:hypothetical protein
MRETRAKVQPVKVISARELWTKLGAGKSPSMKDFVNDAVKKEPKK